MASDSALASEPTSSDRRRTAGNTKLSRLATGKPYRIHPVSTVLYPLGPAPLHCLLELIE
jgi:hypothetical protein